MKLLSRKEATATLGGLAGKQAVSKMDRKRPVATGKSMGRKKEYCSVGIVRDGQNQQRELSVYYLIGASDMPPNGVFKIRPPKLTPVGYAIK